jgi:hypothetical protein
MKITSIAMAFCMMLLVSNLYTTEGYRDYFEDCTTKISGSINGVSVNIETTGSKNNCRESSNNTCSAAGCKSQTVEAIVNAIVKK